MIRRYPLFLHGGAVFADGITSANVVGYQTKEILANDYTMFGIQFQGTDGNGVKLGDLAITPNGGSSSGDADNILVWEDGIYTYYYYGVYGNSKHPEWDNIWYSMSDIVSTDVEIKPGVACWYLRRGEATTLSFTSPLSE